MSSFSAFQEIFARFQNLDLATVAIAVAAIGIMGFVVYFSDRTSATNRAFLAFALMTVSYGTANYFSYKFSDPTQVLLLLRITLFSATLHAFSFFHLFFVFPRKTVTYPRWYVVIFGLVAFVAAMTLTPFVFERIETVANSGVTDPVRGPGLPIFGALAASLVLVGLYRLVKKAYGPTSEVRSQARIILFGAALTFALILTFNVILPITFSVLDFIPLAPVFFLPFIIATSHAIRRYHFLAVKVIATEVLTFVLAVITLIEVIIAHDLSTLLLRIGTFALVLAYGILLIRSVIKEVEQREHLQAMTKELTDANIKLKQLDRIRSEFLSFASHQVKAPMSVVKGYAQLISDGTFGAVPDKVRETSDKIKESADRLIGLVNNLLDLRRLEEGRMEFSFEKSDAGALSKETVDDIRPLAEKKGLTLNVDIPDEPLFASLDVQKFRQVIQNLVDNSIKYTDKGWVKVVASRADRKIVITVSDSGRGMPKDLIPQLFEQFTRERDAAKRIEGTGLGLYIAKQIVLGHKGTLAAASDGPGKGSSFTITLPAA